MPEFPVRMLRQVKAFKENEFVFAALKSAILKFNPAILNPT